MPNDYSGLGLKPKKEVVDYSNLGVTQTDYSQLGLASPAVPASTAVPELPLEQPPQVGLQERELGLGEKLKSFIGGVGTGATAGFMDFSEESPDAVSPGFHTAGEVVGSLLPFGVATKAAKGLGVLRQVKNPFIRNRLVDALSGAGISALEQSGKAARGKEVDLSDIPITAGMFAGLGVAGHSLGRFFKKGADAAKKVVTESKFANPFGTPEIVLKGKNIVEPFMEAKINVESQRNQIKIWMDGVLGGVKRGSDEALQLFKQLDDPSAKLTGKAAEIRGFLDEFRLFLNKNRVARGQDEIPYRKGYITNIFDYAKKQAESVQGGKLPKSLKFPFEKRTGKEGPFKQDIFEALETYFEAGLKDAHIGNALATAVPNVEKLAGKEATKIITQVGGKSYYNLGGATLGTKRHFAESFVKTQLGWPTAVEKAAVNLIRHTGPKLKIPGTGDVTHRTLRKGSQFVTGMFYKSLIGAAFDTGIKNLTQGVNTLAELGVLPTLKGYASLATKKGRTLAKEANLLDEFMPLLHGGEDIALKGNFKKVANAIDNTVLSGPMRFAEFVNRGATYNAAFDVGVKQGMSIEAANKFAKGQVRKLQFAYGKQNISPYFQGAFSRPMYQFFSFPSKQAELMYQWAKEGDGKLLRYLATTGALVIGGKYAGVDISGVFMDPFIMIDPEREEGLQLPFSDKKIKFSTEKLLGSGFFPQGPAPILSAPTKLLKLALSDDDHNRLRAWDEAIKLFVPAGRYGSKVKQAIDEFSGEPIKGRRGRIIRRPTTKETVLKLAGLRSTDAEQAYEELDTVRGQEKWYRRQRQRIIDAMLLGKTDNVTSLRNEMAETVPELMPKFLESLTSEAFEDEYLKKFMTTQQRFYYKNTTRQIIKESLNTEGNDE